MSADRGPSRREMIVASGALLAPASAFAAGFEKRPGMTGAASYFAYVGSRTTRERNARGDGITVYGVDGSTGVWTSVQVVGGLFNPSYLAFDRKKRVLYAIHGDASDISAFRIAPATGHLTLINRQSTEGMNPVHLTIDPTNRFVVVANHVTTDKYASNLAVLPLAEDGALGPATDVVPLKGKVGPHRVEQPFPKPHQVLYDPSQRFIIVPDKGRDLVATYTLGADGKLTAIAAPAPKAREGAGPRHAVFHPRLPFAYVVNELDSTVVAYRFDAASGALTPFQLVSSLPDTFVGDSRGSEIDISHDGRFLYASNRGYDSVAVFAVDFATGRIKPIQWQASGGKTPRFFAPSPDGGRLFVANEDSDTVVALAVDPASGRLSEAGVVAHTGSPTCIVFSDTIR